MLWKLLFTACSLGHYFDYSKGFLVTMSCSTGIIACACGGFTRHLRCRHVQTASFDDVEKKKAYMLPDTHKSCN